MSDTPVVRKSPYGYVLDDEEEDVLYLPNGSTVKRFGWLAEEWPTVCEINIEDWIEWYKEHGEDE